MTLQWDIIKKIRFCFGYGIVRFSKANYVRSLVECSASSVCLRICRQIALITDCFWFLTSAYDESKIPSDPVTMSWRIFRCLYQRAFISISIANPPEWDGNRWRALFPRYCDSFFRCSLTILLDRERYSQRKLSSPPPLREHCYIDPSQGSNQDQRANHSACPEPCEKRVKICENWRVGQPRAIWGRMLDSPSPHRSIFVFAYQFFSLVY